jgi:mono/diheme cytochrome c family protein
MRGLSRTGWVLALALALGGTAIAPAAVRAMDESAAGAAKGTIVANPDPMVAARQEEFAVFQKHCVQCHNSVADPERPGKTRDEWYRIINLMEVHGLEISQGEADMIVDLLFNLRRGIEDTPG